MGFLAAVVQWNMEELRICSTCYVEFNNLRLKADFLHKMKKNFDQNNSKNRFTINSSAHRWSTSCVFAGHVLKVCKNYRLNNLHEVVKQAASHWKVNRQENKKTKARTGPVSLKQWNQWYLRPGEDGECRKSTEYKFPKETTLQISFSGWRGQTWGKRTDRQAGPLMRFSLHICKYAITHLKA